MTLTVENAQATVQTLVSGGLDTVNDRLQEQFDAGSPDVALVMSLNGLRSRYVFDQMRVTRAEISAIDGDPSTAALLAQLSAACDALDGIQKASTADNKWINNTAGALDHVVSAFGLISKPKAAAAK